jgi:glucan phosphoethanolaminetransferase (alkaline phosphatase superfamily)
MNRRLAIVVIGLLLVAPLLTSVFVNFSAIPFSQFVTQIVVTISFFLVPAILFSWRPGVYFYVALPLILLSPFFIFSIVFFRLHPGLEMIAVILQSNAREAGEAVGNLIWYFIPFLLLYVGLYLFLITKPQRFLIPFRTGLAISLAAVVLSFTLIYFENGLYYKPIWQLNRYDLFKTYHYPLSLLSAAQEARAILRNNSLDKAEGFSFQAYRKDSISDRKIFVLVIGEASRYDHWQVNGYPRQTSPRLSKEKNLVSFSNMIAGAHYTWVAVPQLITRATPDDINRQFREKSIIKAFQECDFETAWISNQSDKEIFWTGSIVLHAKTADHSIFSPAYSPNFEFEDIYDERLLPILDKLLHQSKKNLFIVVHTSGQHWDYSRRYPDKFDFFKPSGKTQSLNPPDKSSRGAIINSYDNSILYSDMMLDSVIQMVSKAAPVSYVAFVSDHGEDLFDLNSNYIDFHFHPSEKTLHVPFFIWTSDQYNSLYADKRLMLQNHVHEKLGALNVFYSLIDMANISYPGFDSTKSIASPYFQPSIRKYYGEEKRAVVYDF